MKIQINARQTMGGGRLLATLGDEEAGLAFLDPQYRAVLDKMAFGNEGARQKDRFKLPQMGDAMIADFMGELHRILRPSGHVMLWLDKFTLVERKWSEWVSTDFRAVDLIAWKTGRFGMGYRTRGSTEYLLVLQKPPIRAKGQWSDRGIPDCWVESTDRSVHPHAKPIGLIQRLIRATTKRGELVVDPCAGGYGVLEACVLTAREFIGCDIVDSEKWLT